MKRTCTSLVLIAASLCTGVPVLHAELLNGQVVRTLYFRGVQPDQTAIIADVQTVVGAGLELPAFVGFLRIDFSDTNIFMTATQDASVTPFELVRFITIPLITSVTMNPATDALGFDASRINIATGGQVIDVNLTALRGLGSHHISLDLTGVPVPPLPPSSSPLPVAIAGLNQSVTAGTSFMLDGSQSSDPTGQPLTFTWTQPAGPIVTLDNAQSAKPTFLAPVVTTDTVLTFQLIVSNGTSTSAPATVTITVKTLPSSGGQTPSTAATPTPALTPDHDGGEGGGCALNPGAGFDFTSLGLAGLSLVYCVWQRLRKRQQ
jgi:K319L-like, PKD domain